MPPKNSKSKRSGNGDKQNPSAMAEPSTPGENAPTTEAPEETASGAPPADQNIPPTEEAGTALVEDEQVSKARKETSTTLLIRIVSH